MVDQQKSTIGRRAVAKGIAWSVPAFALATAAPALAVSLPIAFNPDVGSACKLPGNSVPGWNDGLRFPLTITNNSSEDVTITPGSVDFVTTNSSDLGSGRFFALADKCIGENFTSVVIPEGETVTFYYVVGDRGNSSDFVGTITMHFGVKGNDSEREETHSTPDYQINGSNPCEDCKPGNNKDTTVTTDQKAAKAAETAPAEDTSAESSESAAAEEPAASDAGGAEPAASDGGR